MSEEQWYIVAEDGFEKGFPPYAGTPELQAAEGWTPVWLADPDPTVLNRPEFKPAGDAQVLVGHGTQAIHSAYATIDGAIGKRFPVIRGQKYKAEVWAMGLTKTDAPDQPMMGMVIKVDLSGKMDYGGEFPWVESDWWSQDRAEWENGGWCRIETPEFVAQTDDITVYLRSSTRFAAQSNAHFDEFVLLGTGSDGGDGDGGEIAAELLTIADAQLALSMKIRDLASQVGGGSIEAKELIEQAEEKLAEAKTML